MFNCILHFNVKFLYIYLGLLGDFLITLIRYISYNNFIQSVSTISNGI